MSNDLLKDLPNEPPDFNAAELVEVRNLIGASDAYDAKEALLRLTWLGVPASVITQAIKDSRESRQYFVQDEPRPYFQLYSPGV